MSLGISVNREKNGALLAYIAEKNPHITLRKLLKMVYLIDEQFVKLRGFPLTWFDYYAWEKGPVAPEVYEIKNGAFSDCVVCRKNDNGKNIVEAVKNFKQSRLDVFSLFEMDVINDVIVRYTDSSADDLSALTHAGTSLWSQIVKEKGVRFIDGKSNELLPLKRLNVGDAEKEATYEDAFEYMQFCEPQYVTS